VAPLVLELPVMVFPKKHPAELRGIKSIDSKTETAIDFVNRSKQTIKVYWLDYEGNRQLKDTIKEGGSYGMKRTFVSHPWLVTDADDNPWTIYYPDLQPRTVEVRGPDGGAGTEAVSDKKAVAPSR
jgi:hypothetical protein